MESRTLLAGDLGFINVYGSANSFDEGNAVSLDSAGNYYITGGFGGTVDFDPGTSVSNLTANANSLDGFIAKYSPSNALLWAQRIGGSGTERVSGRTMAIDPNGNLWITGQYTGTIDFDPGSGTSIQTAVGNKGEFLLKLNSNGVFQWAGSIEQTTADDFGEEAIAGISIDANGNVLATGRFSGTADFDPGPGVFNANSVLSGATSTYDAFLMKIDNNGAFQWAKAWGGDVTNGLGDQAFAVATDSAGNVYTTGAFAGTVDLDPGAGVQSYTTPGGSLDYDSFTSKFDTAGNLVWVKVRGGQAYDYARAIAVDSGGVYLAGGFNVTSDFDPGPGVANFTAGPSQSDIFVTKLDTSGNYQWTSQMGGAGSYPEYVSGLALDDGGDIYLTGQFSTGADFNPAVGVTTLNPLGGPAAMFVCRLDSNGQLINAVQGGSNGADPPNRIALNRTTKQVFLMGTFSGTVDFDPGTGTVNRTSFDFADAYLLNLNFNTAATGTASITGTAWNDLNGDGQRGGNEPPEPNISVFLDLNGNGVVDAAEPTAITAADGSYSFPNLDAGNYIVRHVPPVNYRITNPTVSGARLFAADTSTNPDRIVELNPTTGAELRSFAPPVANSSGDVGLAFDGQTLYFVSDSNDTLYELNATTGAVLDSKVLASGLYGGLASLSGKVYVLNWSGRVVSIFDPITNAVTTGYDLDSVNPLFFTTHGLGNAAATGELVAATTSGSVAFVNATTGVKNSSFAVDNSNSIGSIEAIGDDILVGYSFTNRLEVYSRTTQAFVRPLNLSFSPKETAGWGDTSGAQRVTLAAGQAATNINFGDQSTLVSIAGTRWQDTNSNGVHDSGEPPVPGKTIYLDVNDNGQRDNGEPTTITASNGSYLFSGLAIGKYVVREEVAAPFQQTFPAVERKRLFVTDVFQNKIVELDPQTGAVLRSIPTPISSQIFNGLAFDSKTLYFISNDNGILYKIDPESGAVIGQTTLPSGSYQEMGFLNGLVYINALNTGQIKVFDPVTNTIIKTIAVTGASGSISYGLGEITGPDRILAVDFGNKLIAVDPATGAATPLFTLNTYGPYALTSVGQEIFAGDSGGSNGLIEVYSRSGSLLRTFDNATTPAAFALAGMQWTETAQRVTLGYGQNATGLDFGTTELAVAPSSEISLAGGNITIADTSISGKDDQWRLERSGTDIKLTDLTGGTIDAAAVPGASGSGTSVVTFPLSLMQPTSHLIVDTRDGNDVLTIDLSGGNPIPGGGIDYSGGNPTTAPGDKLNIIGGSQGTVTYNFTNGHDGSIAMTNYGTVRYTGLEPIVNSGTASDLIFNLPAAASTAFLEDDGTSGNGLSRLRSSNTTFETTTFANPTGSLTINRGNSGDAITISDLPDFNVGLTVGSSALGFGSIALAGALILSADKSLTAYALGKISIPNATSNVATSGIGSISLTTSRNIVVSTGAALSTVDGGILLTANQQPSATSGNFSGISISGSVTTTGTGNIVLKGNGGTDATTSLHMGVDVLSGVVRSAATRADAGKISIVGIGGVGTADNDGVAVEGAGASVESVSGDIQITGTGGNGSTTLNRGIAVINGGQIKSTGTGATAADINLSGTGGTGTSTNYGVVFGASALATTVNGNFTVVGQGGNSVSGGQSLGVLVTSGGIVEGGITGLLSITGTGGASSGSVKSGVRVINAGSRIDSSGADILVTGFGGAGGSFNRGVELFSGGQIFAGGSGTVTVTGTGGAATGDENQGVLVNGATTSIGSASGDVVITGTGGGTGAAVFNAGVGSVSNGFFSAGGSGSLKITGTAGNPANASNAVSIGAGGATAGGDIVLTGTPVNDSASAVSLAGIVAPGAGGNVVVVGDRVTIATGGGINAPSQSVTLRPKTVGQAIDLGGSDSATALGLTDQELDLILARTLLIGDVNSGPLTLTSDLSRPGATDLVLASSGTINFLTGSVNTGGGKLTLSPGAGGSVGVAHAGVDAALGPMGTLSFALGSDLAIALSGTAVDSQYEELHVAGLVDLTGVDLLLSGTYAPRVGDPFVLVNNDGDDAVVGTFNGLPESQVFRVTSGGLDTAFAITYIGGDGNDVVLTAVNTAPVFVKGSDQSATDEDGPRTLSGWASNLSPGLLGESNQQLHFVVTGNTNLALFAAGPSIAGDGTLTFTPKPNAHGAAEITIVLVDDGGGDDTSTPQKFTITVNKLHRLFNAAETGSRRGLDVTGSTSSAPDGAIVAGDALAVINYINAKGSGHVADDSPYGPPYCDVNGDNQVVAEDVLKIINYINANSGKAEGEFSASLASSLNAPSTDLFTLLAQDLAETAVRRRRAQ